MKTKEEVYDIIINPLMRKVINVCRDNDIEFLASFHLETISEDDIYFCTTHLKVGEKRKEFCDMRKVLDI